MPPNRFCDGPRSFWWHPNPLTRILQRFDLQPNAIAIATLPLGALSVEFVSFTEARDSPRVFQRHRAIIKKASRKLRVSEAEIFRRALEAFAY